MQTKLFYKPTAVAGADYKITQAAEVVAAAAPGVSEAVLQPQPEQMVATPLCKVPRKAIVLVVVVPREVQEAGRLLQKRLPMPNMVAVVVVQAVIPQAQTVPVVEVLYTVEPEVAVVGRAKVAMAAQVVIGEIIQSAGEVQAGQGQSESMAQTAEVEPEMVGEAVVVGLVWLDSLVAQGEFQAAVAAEAVALTRWMVVATAEMVAKEKYEYGLGNS